MYSNMRVFIKKTIFFTVDLHEHVDDAVVTALKHILLYLLF